MSTIAPATVRTPRADHLSGTRPTLVLDLAAIAANVGHFARLATELMAVVKADGFGHGAEAIARTALAHGASSLGVTSADEAHALRDAGIVAPVLSWLNPVATDWAGLIRRRIDLAVPGLDHLEAIRRAALRLDRPARIHLQADVGLARDGAPPAEWEQLCRRARQAEDAGQVQVIGLMGHLANAGTGPDELGRRRFERFLATAVAAGLTDRMRHLAGTDATLSDPGSRYDLSRIGAGLYGIGASGLRYALTLTAPVVCIREVDAGTGVGYQHTHLTSRPTRLALLPVGYGDGLPRAASHRAEVLISGRRRPVVGLFSMDQLVVDIGDQPVAIGENAIVFGPGDQGEPTPADWAEWSGSIPHELLTGLGHRLDRRRVDSRGQGGTRCSQDQGADL